MISPPAPLLGTVHARPECMPPHLDLGTAVRPISSERILPGILAPRLWQIGT
jgi:hypothetical protein